LANRSRIQVEARNAHAIEMVSEAKTANERGNANTSAAHGYQATEDKG
jgi:hypothetical protein